MQWPLPHAVTLTFHGNAILSGATANRGVFHGPDWLSQRLNAARFTRRKETPDITVMGAADWLADLSSRGARRIWLRHLEGGRPSLPPVFAEHMRRKNRARVALQVEGETSTELWLIPDDQLRLVELAASAPEPIGQQAGSVEDARARLGDVLSRLIEHAEIEELSDWRRAFQGFLEYLRDPSREPEWHDGFPRDLFPDTALDREAAHLLASVCRSWVFGGHRDWMQAASGNPAREELSRELWMALSGCVEAATDSSCR